DAILFAHKQIKTIVEMIEELRSKAGLPTKQLPPAPEPAPLNEEMFKKYASDFRERKLTSGKQDRADKIKELKEKLKAEYAPEGSDKYTPAQVSAAFAVMEERVVRDLILEGKRIDGRTAKQIRPIECEVSVLPRTHGSAVFQRGETQALVIATLGTVSDEQR